MLHKTAVLLGLCGALLLAAACEHGAFKIDWPPAKGKAEVEEKTVATPVKGITTSLAYRDTVAQQGVFDGLRFMRVRGYGVVAGLGTRGSRECPEPIRRRLLQEMYKLDVFSHRGGTAPPVTPEQLLDDLDTAVVVIEGDIPAAAPKGTRFDVTVRALPGTQTVSLEGGRLYTAELHIFRETQPDAWIEGKVLANAAGPVFVNPFGGDEESATPRTLREGRILGGGVSLEDRRVRFVLSRPSFQRAQAITSAINQRFPSQTKAANPPSQAGIDITVPPAFRDDPFRFLALIRHLYLPRGPGFVDQRAQDLAREILDPDAPHADIALALEGIGRTVLPTVEKLYTESRPHARFYAALAGLRLGNDVAVEVIDAFARDERSPYRLTAIEELGRAKASSRAATVLRGLLDDPDPRIRVEAYEALVFRKDESLRSRSIGGNDFQLDVVPSPQPALAYIRRAGAPRIALIGSDVRCQPPVFYRDAEGMLTISADVGDTSLTLLRKTPYGNRVSPPLPGPLDVAELVAMLGDRPEVLDSGQVHGLAFDYSAVSHVLYELCRLRCVNAKFMMQSPSVTEMFGPLPPTGRPESEL